MPIWCCQFLKSAVHLFFEKKKLWKFFAGATNKPRFEFAVFRIARYHIHLCPKKNICQLWNEKKTSRQVMRLVQSNNTPNLYFFHYPHKKKKENNVWCNKSSFRGPTPLQIETFWKVCFCDTRSFFAHTTFAFWIRNSRKRIAITNLTAHQVFFFVTHLDREKKRREKNHSRPGKQCLF